MSKAYYTTLILACIVFISFIPYINRAQIGFAEDVTGGAGGDTFVVTGPTQFTAAIVWNQPLVIIVDGTINLTGMHDVTSDKTIVGLEDKGKIVGGGLRISERSNIIIRNIAFSDWNDDAINIENDASRVWVDHCDFTNGQDGCVDIRLGADLVTVSWNHFWNHDKVSLLGASDNNGAINEGKLRVTYHHNWFDGTGQRHPRARFSELCHIFNNYFLDNTLYSIGSTMEADLLVEKNYFEDCRLPTEVGVGSSGPGDLELIDNIIINNELPPESRGEVEDPPYSYTADDPENIPMIVMNWAGVQSSLSSTRNQSAETASFRVAPNPFSDVIQVILEKGESGTLTVYDLEGRLVSKANLTGEVQSMNLEGLSSGAYIMQLLTDAGRMGYHRIVKN